MFGRSVGLPIDRFSFFLRMLCHFKCEFDSISIEWVILELYCESKLKRNGGEKRHIKHTAQHINDSVAQSVTL